MFLTNNFYKARCAHFISEGFLSEEKISLLEQIGMVWGIGIEHRWNENKRLAKKNNEENTKGEQL